MSRAASRRFNAVLRKLCLSRGLLAEVSLNTAVNVEYLTVYEIRCLGSKEYCRACKILGIAPTACGSLGIGDEAIEGMLTAISLRLTKGCGLGSSNVDGRPIPSSSSFLTSVASE